VNALTIVDTDILIDAALQINKAIDCLDGLEQNSMLAISVITQMEKNGVKSTVDPCSKFTRVKRGE